MKRINRNILLFSVFALAVVVSALLYVTSPRDECSRINSRQNMNECYEKDIKRALLHGGVFGGIERVRELSQTSSKFSGLCHNYAHSIGVYAYDQFTKDKSFTLSPGMSYCSYGFYHGFMEEMLAQSGDYKKAAQFCLQFKQKSGPRENNLDKECYHGIGHGFVDEHIPTDWQDVEGTVRRAISVCQAVMDSEEDFRNCAGGVYNGIANVYLAGEYGVTVTESDPLWLCKEAAPSLQSDCYNYMARVFLRTSNRSFERALNQAITHTEVKFQEIVVAGLANMSAVKRISNMTDSLKACLALDFYVQDACLGGFALGLVQSGPPSKEYAGGIDFCSRVTLSAKQSENCFTRIAWNLKRLHTSNDLFRACVLYASPLYQRICTNTLAD